MPIKTTTRISTLSPNPKLRRARPATASRQSNQMEQNLGFLQRFWPSIWSRPPLAEPAPRHQTPPTLRKSAACLRPAARTLHQHPTPPVRSPPPNCNCKLSRQTILQHPVLQDPERFYQISVDTLQERTFLHNTFAHFVMFGHVPPQHADSRQNSSTPIMPKRSPNLPSPLTVFFAFLFAPASKRTRATSS